MMMGAVVKHYWAKKMGLRPEDVCLVGRRPDAAGCMQPSGCCRLRLRKLAARGVGGVGVGG